jgi:ribosomal protein S18 acetylase RimI-like enzyme
MVAMAIPVTEFTISTDKKLIDCTWLVPEIQSMPWGKGAAVDRICDAISSDKSLCFGLYRHVGEPVQLDMIGFARVVGDGITFSSIMDLVIDEQYRKQGLGTRLMQDILEHPEVKGTCCILGTELAVLPESAAKFYKKFGFNPCSGVMVREP